MTNKMFEMLEETLQGSEYEEIISDSNFKRFTKFFKIENGDTSAYTAWYNSYLNITIYKNGSVFVANYLTGRANVYY